MIGESQVRRRAVVLGRLEQKGKAGASLLEKPDPAFSSASRRAFLKLAQIRFEHVDQEIRRARTGCPVVVGAETLVLEVCPREPQMGCLL